MPFLVLGFYGFLEHGRRLRAAVYVISESVCVGVYVSVCLVLRRKADPETIAGRSVVLEATRVISALYVRKPHVT